MQCFRSLAFRHFRPLWFHLRHEPPADLRTARHVIADPRKIVPLHLGNYPARRSKYFLPAGKKIVEGFLKVWRRFRELASDLKNVFLVALLNLVLEKLLQRAVA